jgi:PAS domain S-box-containing protein
MSIFALGFTVHYLDRRSRWADLGQGLGLLVIAAFSIPLFGHQLISNPQLDAWGVVVQDLNAWGGVGAVVIVIFLVWSLILFWQERHRKEGLSLAASMLILLLGIVGGSVLDLPFPFLSITNTIGVVILAYAVLSRQLFNPLVERSAELQQEIAEHEWAEKALRDSEERYRTLFHSGQDAIFVLRGERFIDCNRATEAMFGRARDGIVGRTPFDLSPARQPDGRDSMEKALELALARLAGEHRVETANSGQEALTKMDVQPFDLVITDFWMPGMDGLELIARIRATYPKTRLILVTACADPQIRVTAEQLRLQGCFSMIPGRNRLFKTTGDCFAAPRRGGSQSAGLSACDNQSKTFAAKHWPKQGSEVVV